MRLSITLLGLDLFTLEIATDNNPDNGADPGDCTSMVVGFAPSPGDQRWERGVELD